MSQNSQKNHIKRHDKNPNFSQTTSGYGGSNNSSQSSINSTITNSQNSFLNKPHNSSQSQYNPNPRRINDTRTTKSDYQPVNKLSRSNNGQPEIPQSSTVFTPIASDRERKKIIQRKYIQTPDVWDKYERVMKIGQGTFGEVFKAKKIMTEKEKLAGTKPLYVALKRVIMDHEREGFPITALREIKILQTLNRKGATYGNNETDDPIGHQNIVKLIEVCRCLASNGDSPASLSVFLVFEFCEHDLFGLLKQRSVQFDEAETKSLVQQMLRGLMYIHGKRIFHRDMKTANVLVTLNGVIKLADFGLARGSYVTSSRQLTNNVVTLWYRPPELLLGESNYTSAIDVWACGCIMGELWQRGTPIMSANVELEQLRKIIELCGSITETDWPKAFKLKDEKKRLAACEPNKPRMIRKKYEKIMGGAIQLFDEMLKLNPEKRITANSALDNFWLWEKPLPKLPNLHKLKESQFELLNRKKNEKEQQQKHQQRKNANDKLIGHGDSMAQSIIY